MSDVWSEIIEKLKQKAKKFKEISIENVPILYKMPFVGELWVRLEDVQQLLEEIKRDYVLVSRKKLREKLGEIKLYGTKINGQLSDFIEKELLKEC